MKKTVQKLELCPAPSGAQWLRAGYANEWVNKSEKNCLHLQKGSESSRHVYKVRMTHKSFSNKSLLSPCSTHHLLPRRHSTNFTGVPRVNCLLPAVLFSCEQVEILHSGNFLNPRKINVRSTSFSILAVLQCVLAKGWENWWWGLVSGVSCVTSIQPTVISASVCSFREGCAPPRVLGRT